MKNKKTIISNVLLYQFIGFTVAVGGWLWEVFLFLIKEHEFVNRGFFYGPWLPVYGIGAVLLSLVFYHKKIAVRLTHLQESNLYHNREQKKPSRFAKAVRTFFICMLGGSFLEFVVGWFLWHVFHQRYWDYSGYVGNLYGYVCIFSALGFGIFGALWICEIAPRLIRLWSNLQLSVRFLVIGLLNVLFLTDVIFSLLKPNTGANITFSFFALSL